MTPTPHTVDEHISRIWALKRNGDHINTGDMCYFVEKMTPVRDMLLSMGIEFQLAWRPISDVINDFNTYLLARGVLEEYIDANGRHVTPLWAEVISHFTRR
jgi:hypothetical protein